MSAEAVANEQRGPLSREQLEAMGYIIGVKYDDDTWSYDSDPCQHPSLNQSIAHVLVKRSAAHAWTRHPKFGRKRRQATDEMEEGSILDSLLLSDGEGLAIIDHDDYRTKAAREARDAARAEGKTPILREKLRFHEYRANGITARLELAGVDLSAGKRQVPVYWVEYTDDWQPVQCRGKLDQVIKGPPVVIRDLKKTQDASDAALPRTIIRYGYDIQAAAYTRAVEQIQGESGRTRYEWVFAEPEEPYAVNVAEPAGSMMQLGTLRWRRAVNLWHRAITTGMWPGFEKLHPLRIEAPSYALEEMMNDNDEEASDE